MNNLELCQQTCAMLLKANPDNEVASVMMADIAFRKVNAGFFGLTFLIMFLFTLGGF